MMSRFLWCLMSDVMSWFLFVVFDVRCGVIVYVCGVRCQM